MPYKGMTESDLADLVKQTPELTFGYIGNYETWGDTRRLYIWIKNVDTENGNQASIWSCEATDFDNAAYFEATMAIGFFCLGLQAARANDDKQQIIDDLVAVLEMTLDMAMRFEAQASKGASGRRGGPVFTKARAAISKAKGV